MAAYDAELLDVADRLLVRADGQRGRLSGALIRRSISTCYYAIFHFMLEEIGRTAIGTRNGLRERRRLLGRTIAHTAMRTTFVKLRGAEVENSISPFFRFASAASGAVGTPPFVHDLANAFLDAQSKRHDADYDLNAALSEADARLLVDRVKKVVAAWRAANGARESEFKQAVCILVLLRGQLRDA